ncbi:GNAT family N-acetyltransferase [Legionella longbeachae]|uniref:N-terminal acetyltransferase, GNAT family n=1 Tax=Legionella longbeachae serogroup 1 (strain NSW150) TaxID=661367 RepID=D3HMS6_LEGLN|nr:GNAT family N-acetyltransferase [Legionella longbeachae]VEE04277.1 N-terminal GNAT family acetyltransferase [Legionella oakridgensis]HBD7397047.1 GNAT family N-acetyltransferase [Legionella pneumophila]ARB92896.1 N-acetyltransferase [Legionella longbeachae]ARM33963.1 GNAT family N-acetyltransferase [Legionella longbeachae]EEZ96830.1 GNAT family N-acetyltransferase [Legionella longbeachae D-4968]
MLSNTNQLTEDQLKDLEQLKAICKKSDGSVPNLYTHLLTQKRNFPTILLNYENQKLIGFLSVYFFYDDAVEVSLLIHPSFRRQGMAKKLLRSILPLIKEQNFFKLIFSSPAHLNHHWLPDLGCSYMHSEYYMERNDLSPLLDYKKDLTFRTATLKDIPFLCVLDESCFFKKQAELIPRFEHILGDRNYQIILAFEDNHIVGKAHLRWQKDGATLSDIAVLPIRQGKGLGTALIAHCINFALSEGKPHLNLDVETHNQKALNLYSRLGFLTQNACDYWEIDLYQLEKLIKQKRGNQEESKAEDK